MASLTIEKPRRGHSDETALISSTYLDNVLDPDISKVAGHFNIRRLRYPKRASLKESSLLKIRGLGFEKADTLTCLRPQRFDFSTDPPKNLVIARSIKHT